MLNLLKKIIRYFTQLAAIRYDKEKFFKYYTDTVVAYDEKCFYEREIMVLCHTVEKGLSHNTLKPLFGLGNVKKISEYLSRYIQMENISEYIVTLACNTLKEYNDVNQKLGVGKENLIYIPEISSTIDLEIGIDKVTEEEFFSGADGSFPELLKGRRSVRLYDTQSEQIPLSVLRKCISDALVCPNACNRQAVRVKIVTDREKITQICELQGGARGFGNNAGALLIITSDIRYYMVSERRLPMLDCGIYIMNLCYSLYNKRLGSCILNSSFSKQQEKELGFIVQIPKYEMIAAIVAVSNIPKGTDFKVAKSCKKDAEEIISVL